MIVKPISPRPPAEGVPDVALQAHALVAARLEHAYGAAENVLIFHDLLLPLKSAQDVLVLDHLLVFAHGFIVIGSQQLLGYIRKTPEGSWRRRVDGKYLPLPSPERAIERQYRAVRKFLHSKQARIFASRQGKAFDVEKVPGTMLLVKTSGVVLEPPEAAAESIDLEDLEAKLSALMQGSKPQGGVFGLLKTGFGFTPDELVQLQEQLLYVHKGMQERVVFYDDDETEAVETQVFDQVPVPLAPEPPASTHQEAPSQEVLPAGSSPSAVALGFEAGPHPDEVAQQSAPVDGVDSADEADGAEGAALDAAAEAVEVAEAPEASLQQDAEQSAAAQEENEPLPQEPQEAAVIDPFDLLLDDAFKDEGASGVGLITTASRNKPACKHCGEHTLMLRRSQYGHYMRCLNCLKDTGLDVHCPVCGADAEIARREDEYHVLCALHGHETFFYKNPDKRALIARLKQYLV